MKILKILWKVILALYGVFLIWAYTVNPMSAFGIAIGTVVIATPCILFGRWIWKECKKSGTITFYYEHDDLNRKR